MWAAWFSIIFQANTIVVPCKFIIPIFLKKSFLLRFSWKKNFGGGRCFVRCWLNCWYRSQCFNQSKPFFVFTFFHKFAFKLFNAYHCWRNMRPVFPINKIYPTIVDIFITLEWKHREYFLSFIIIIVLFFLVLHKQKRFTK